MKILTIKEIAHDNKKYCDVEQIKENLRRWFKRSGKVTNNLIIDEILSIKEE